MVSLRGYIGKARTAGALKHSSLDNDIKQIVFIAVPSLSPKYTVINETDLSDGNRKHSYLINSY